MTREAVSAAKPAVRAQVKTGKVHGAASAAVLKGLVYGAAVLTFAVLLFLIGYILVTGIPHLKPSLFQWNYTSENVSMMPAILTTVETTALALPRTGSAPPHMHSADILFFHPSPHI